MKTVKCECLSKMILFGEAHLRRTLSAFVAHDQQDRPHQSLDNNRCPGSEHHGVE